MSTTIMPKEAVGCESGLVGEVEALTGEKWESISHHLSEKAVMLLTQSDSDPVGFLVIDTEVKEDTFLYIKRMEIGKGLGHEELEKLANHILSQALDQAREMGFSQLLVEEDRLSTLDLLRRHGFHEWRRDLVMEIGTGTIPEIETDTRICVDSVLGDVDALVKTWNDIVASNPGSFIDRNMGTNTVWGWKGRLPLWKGVETDRSEVFKNRSARRLFEMMSADQSPTLLRLIKERSFKIVRAIASTLLGFFHLFDEFLSVPFVPSTYEEVYP